MLGRGYPQISVVVDLLGDVYLYREAAFIGRVGADRYIIGRLTPEVGLAELLQRYLADSDRSWCPVPGTKSSWMPSTMRSLRFYARQATISTSGLALSGVPVPSGLYHPPANLWR